MNIPTIASIRQAASIDLGTIHHFDVGVRLDKPYPDGDVTEDMNLWGEDEDLADLWPLKDILAGWRKTPPPSNIQIDLYCYAPENASGDYLLGNLDLRYCEELGRWFVCQQYVKDSEGKQIGLGNSAKDIADANGAKVLSYRERWPKSESIPELDQYFQL